MKNFVLITVVGLLLMSCATGQLMSTQADHYLLPEHCVKSHPYVADLSISNTKVSMECEWRSSTNDISPAMIETAKSDAVNSLKVKHGADVIVAPSFVVEIRGYKIIVTISGYPATYINFKKATQEDEWLFDLYRY